MKHTNVYIQSSFLSKSVSNQERSLIKSRLQYKRTVVRKEKVCIILRQNFAILAIVHSKSGSFITCVFGIVLRSADSTHTLLHYEAKASLLHARVGIFFSDKILVNSRRGKTTGQCGVRHGGDNILLRQKSFFSTQKSRNILDLS